MRGPHPGCQALPGMKKWAEARREAVNAVSTVSVRCAPGVQAQQGLLPNILDCLLNDMEDYTLDRRGDTGAWVREAAILGMESLFFCSALRLPSSSVGQLVASMARQAVKKIERTRALAGQVLHSLRGRGHQGGAAGAAA